MKRGILTIAYIFGTGCTGVLLLYLLEYGAFAWEQYPKVLLLLISGALIPNVVGLIGSLTGDTGVKVIQQVQYRNLPAKTVGESEGLTVKRAKVGAEDGMTVTRKGKTFSVPFSEIEAQIGVKVDTSKKRK